MTGIQKAAPLATICGLLFLSGQAVVWSSPSNAPSAQADKPARQEKASEKQQGEADRANGQKLGQAMHKADAIYPKEAAEKGVEGRVVVEITVNEQGEVADARVKDGPELLRRAAIDAARQWRFSNPTKQRIVATLAYEFRLGAEQRKATPPATQQSGPDRPGKDEPGIKLIKRVDPVYPEEAQEKGVEGKVVVEITINEKGEVSYARVIEGPELLHKAALEAAKQWLFSNPTKRPAVARITLSFEQ